jgi:glyoxylase-like metal-dependent hydrolase (beta-lactamase superfamily II)
MALIRQLGSTMRVFQPAANVLAFYDGRVEGVRAHSEKSNWLDDGAYSLGISSYAIVDGREALVYDTHISIAHARAVRQTLQDMGVRSIRVVLSHWHDDHVAGNEVFADCEMIAHALTARVLAGHKEALESGNPPIKPLILPNRTYEGGLELKVGRIPVELRHADIHSLDGTVLLLSETGLLLAGDTLEDPITSVDEPARLAIHLDGLRQISDLNISQILPNHGSPALIEAGGYGTSLIAATRRYVEKLLRCRTEPELAEQDLRTFVAKDLAACSIFYLGAK